MKIVVDVLCVSVLILFVVLSAIVAVNEVRVAKAPRYNGVVIKQYTDKVAVRVAYDVQYNGHVFSYVHTYPVTSEEYASLSVGDRVDFDENNKLIVDSKKGE